VCKDHCDKVSHRMRGPWSTNPDPTIFSRVTGE
jgi:hypothetical protein